MDDDHYPHDRYDEGGRYGDERPRPRYEDERPRYEADDSYERERERDRYDGYDRRESYPDDRRSDRRDDRDHRDDRDRRNSYGDYPRDRSPSPRGDPRDRSRSPPRREYRPSESRNGDYAGVANTGSNLFVTGISPRLVEDDIRDRFQQFGVVENCSILTDPHTGESRCFGFVKMANADQADAAMKGLSGEVTDGRTLSIERARRDRPRSPTPGRYYGPPKGGIRRPPPRPYREPRSYRGYYSRHDDYPPPPPRRGYPSRPPRPHDTYSPRDRYSYY